MALRVFQVDAFTSRPFAGNPAAVVPLDAWPEDSRLASIAREMNLSETAFFVRDGEGFHLRWFTPTDEVDLCGHATLASAFVLFTELEPERSSVTFATRSGPLSVVRDGRVLAMDFPSRPPAPIAMREDLVTALGARPKELLSSRDVVAVFDDAATIRSLSPDLSFIASLKDVYAVCVTAPGTGVDSDVDFVSRFFAPGHGVPEDPVTGSAHCTLCPYWSDRLGKCRLQARQVGGRIGDLVCERRGDRVRLEGEAVLVLRGELLV